MDRSSAIRCGLAWHPDGSLLAVAGTNNNVIIYERLSWEPLHQLDDAHTGLVNCLKFSPNGEHNPYTRLTCSRQAGRLHGDDKYIFRETHGLTSSDPTGLYLASGGRDKKITVWDVEKKEVLSRTDAGAVPSALAWHPGPSNNTLAYIGEDGRIQLWNSAIPAHMLTPSALLDDSLPRPATSQDPSPGIISYTSRLEVKIASFSGNLRIFFEILESMSYDILIDTPYILQSMRQHTAAP